MELLQAGNLLFDRFRIVETIGAGGQAFTFTGIDMKAPDDRPWEKNVFIKQYHDLIPHSEESILLRNHFNQLKARLSDNSNYLCLPIYLGDAMNSVIAVYPKVRGKSLRDWMNEGIMQSQCTRFSIAITNAVRIIHKVGIIHLDLKPENVMISENPKRDELYVILIDLDASRIDGKGLRNSIIGTPLYMSPEHFNPTSFGQVSEKSDVFTLGIMLFELLFKQHPFSGRDYETSVINQEFSIPDNNYHWEVVNRVIDSLNPDNTKRPKSGWIHSTLHAHYLNSFEAVNIDDKWNLEKKSKKVAMISDKIESSAKSPIKSIQFVMEHGGIFRRTYYENVTIGRNELRGSGIKDLPSAIFKIDLLHRNIVGLCDRVEILLDGKQLIINSAIELRHNQLLEINKIKFRLSLRD